jgi:hypothetical protein
VGVRVAIVRFFRDGNYGRLKEYGRSVLARVWVLAANRESRGIEELEKARGEMQAKQAKDVDDFIKLVKAAPWPENQKSTTSSVENE